MAMVIDDVTARLVVVVVDVIVSSKHCHDHRSTPRSMTAVVDTVTTHLVVVIVEALPWLWTPLWSSKHCHDP